MEPSVKCPICRVDHYMICHSCPHNGRVAGQAYAASPCAFCDKDHHGKARRNDSREGGHGRVVSLELLERYVGDELPAEEEGENQQTSEHDLVLDFIGAFCRMDIRTQYLVEQRIFFGKSLEGVAADYRAKFGRPMTVTGVSASVSAATSRIASALRPQATTPGRTSGDAALSTFQA